MIGTAHAFHEVGRQFSADYGGSGFAGTMSTLWSDWQEQVPTQTTTAVRNVMRADQFSCGATAVQRSMSSPGSGVGLTFVVLNGELEALSLLANPICKWGFGSWTSPPAEVSVEVSGSCIWSGSNYSREVTVEPTASLSAARVLAQIKQASGLTIEAMGPLVGVSRRTLHGWLAGARISQRNEERLRALAEALEVIAATAPAPARLRLMERVPGSPQNLRLACRGLLRRRNRSRDGHARATPASGLSGAPSPFDASFRAGRSSGRSIASF